MIPLVHPVLPQDARLWGAARPGYPEEPASPESVEKGVRAWAEAGVDVVVSLIEDWELIVRCPGLYEKVGGHGIEVLRFPIVNHTGPSDAVAFSRLLDEVRARLAEGHGVLVHCNAGMGRTPVVLASLLKRCGFAGDAVDEIRRVYHPDAMLAAQVLFVRTFVPASEGS